MKLYCRARVSDYSGDIEELAKKYSKDFVHLPVGREDVDKYALCMKTKAGLYVLMISHCDLPNPDYNTIMSVMGPRPKKVKRLMVDWKTKSGVKTRRAPKHLDDVFQDIARYFYGDFTDIFYSEN